VNILAPALLMAMTFGGFAEVALAHSASPQPLRRSSAQVVVPPPAAARASQDSYNSGDKQQSNSSPEAVKAYWESR
jgi:hypothetical protein